MKDLILERFLRYVQVDTESVFGVETIPSTKKQFDLAEILVEELKAIGMEDVTLDENCYIMATLPSNTDKDVPVIGFVAHIDTTPDFTGANVKPQVWQNYDGGDVMLNEAENIVLSPDEFPKLKGFKGETLITTDGTTLLGADDKAGVTEIMSAMDYLIKHPEIKHGKIRICFTPDEEVGRGADLFDVEKFGAEWAYTMDGSQVGELEYENFNAAYAEVAIQGKVVHPGYAKNQLVNSMYIASEFIQELPAEEVPEKTEGYEGFFHLLGMEGTTDFTKLSYIIRDHDRQLFEIRKVQIETVAAMLNAKHDNRIKLTITDQYFNMREKVEPMMHIVDLAEAAMKDLNIEPQIKPIRGGTDGSKLSFMGLPCPNIFAGGMNFHSRYEYVTLETMEKATQTIVKIVEKLEAQA